MGWGRQKRMGGKGKRDEGREGESEGKVPYRHFFSSTSIRGANSHIFERKKLQKLRKLARREKSLRNINDIKIISSPGSYFVDSFRRVAT